MADIQTVHILYKNLGETPNQCILRFKKDSPEYANTPMTYAGRLDPMAEGLLLVLSGEELMNKDKYLDLQKTYEFEILWGFETDTLDLLGLVSLNNKVHNVEKEKIQDKLKNSIGKFEQLYPSYSSKPVLGKPLFQWAREGRLSEIEIPKHMVEIFDINYLSRRTISKEYLLEDINSKILRVSGDFRQKETLEKWQEILEKSKEKEFSIDKFSTTVSSGFYVRQFVQDIANSLGVVATTFHIKRISVGGFKINS